nr:late embryogenesis abundant protein At5g17165 [Ipomoea batatas]
MAGSLHVGRLSILEKRLVSQFTSTTTPTSALSSPLLTWKRKVQSSVYDKIPDEYIHPYDVVQPGSGEYWTPHPETGVFGPASNHNHLASHSMPVGAAVKQSVLELKVFFRSLEDLDK